MTTPSHPTLEDARILLEAATSLLERAIEAGRKLTGNVGEGLVRINGNYAKIVQNIQFKHVDRR